MAGSVVRCAALWFRCGGARGSVDCRFSRKLWIETCYDQDTGHNKYPIRRILDTITRLTSFHWQSSGSSLHPQYGINLIVPLSRGKSLGQVTRMLGASK